jgi:hypothetical protein
MWWAGERRSNGKGSGQECPLYTLAFAADALIRGREAGGPILPGRWTAGGGCPYMC